MQPDTATSSPDPITPTTASLLAGPDRTLRSVDAVAIVCADAAPASSDAASAVVMNSVLMEISSSSFAAMRR